MSDLRILAFAGSTRQASFNRQLLGYAATRLREQGADVEIFELRDHRLPLYDQDEEQAGGIPENAKKLRASVLSADAVLIACPEYSAGMTAVLKNALDWCSRKDLSNGTGSVFAGKPAGLLSASPGRLGGIRGLVHTRLVLIEMGAHVSPSDACIGMAHEALGESGKPNDDRTLGLVEGTLRDLVRLAKSLKS